MEQDLQLVLLHDAICYLGYTLLVYEYANLICALHTFHRLVDLEKVNIFDKITDFNSPMTG